MKRHKKVFGLVLVAFMVMMASVLSACADEPDPVDENADVTAAFVDDRVSFVGRTVTVSGVVGTELAPTGFLLAGNAFGASPVLVIDSSATELSPGDAVRVTGLVRNFDLVEFERDLTTELDDTVFNPYAGQPTIVADEVTVMDDAAGGTTSTTTAGDLPTTTSSTTTSRAAS